MELMERIEDLRSEDTPLTGGLRFAGLWVVLLSCITLCGTVVTLSKYAVIYWATLNNGSEFKVLAKYLTGTHYNTNIYYYLFSIAGFCGLVFLIVFSIHNIRQIAPKLVKNK